MSSWRKEKREESTHAPSTRVCSRFICKYYSKALSPTYYTSNSAAMYKWYYIFVDVIWFTHLSSSISHFDESFHSVMMRLKYSWRELDSQHESWQVIIYIFNSARPSRQTILWGMGNDEKVIKNEIPTHLHWQHLENVHLNPLARMSPIFDKYKRNNGIPMIPYNIVITLPQGVLGA